MDSDRRVEHAVGGVGPGSSFVQVRSPKLYLDGEEIEVESKDYLQRVLAAQFTEFAKGPEQGQYATLDDAEKLRGYYRKGRESGFRLVLICETCISSITETTSNNRAMLYRFHQSWTRSLGKSSFIVRRGLPMRLRHAFCRHFKGSIPLEYRWVALDIVHGASSPYCLHIGRLIATSSGMKHSDDSDDSNPNGPGNQGSSRNIVPP